jgi:hypothetical protein
MLDLKRIVDSARENVDVAERETTGLAIGSQVNDPLKMLRLVVERCAHPTLKQHFRWRERRSKLPSRGIRRRAKISDSR